MTQLQLPFDMTGKRPTFDAARAIETVERFLVDGDAYDAALASASAYAQEDINQDVRKLACEAALIDLDPASDAALGPTWVQSHRTLLRFVLRVYLRSLPSLGAKL